MKCGECKYAEWSGIPDTVLCTWFHYHVGENEEAFHCEVFELKAKQEAE